jgi:ubiquinone/menaquinone biosynthesis C-methylase UbiE
MGEESGFQFTDDAVPRAYDELLVPRLFEPWALLLLDETDLPRNAAVLDVATGPGTVARLAAARIGPNGRVVATDVSRPMLDVANSKPAPPDAAPITYVESPAAPLAVESTAFDVVVCQQGLQFFPDRLAALGEMRRALKPGGWLAVAVWCRIEDNAIYAALHAALRDSVPADLADRLLAPFSWPDPRAVKDAIEAAGFRDIRARAATLPLVFEGGIAPAAGALSASPLGPALAALPGAAQGKLNAAIAARLTPFLKDGKVEGHMASNIAVARLGVELG